jgi:glycine hydroxymethyltransferase
MKEEHMDKVVGLIDQALQSPDDDQVLCGVKKEINAFMQEFPLYPELG